MPKSFEKHLSADEMKGLISTHYSGWYDYSVKPCSIIQEVIGSGVSKLYFRTDEVLWYQEHRLTDTSRRKYTLTMVMDQGLPKGKALGLEFMAILAEYPQLIPKNIKISMAKGFPVFAIGGIQSDGGGFNAEAGGYQSSMKKIPILYGGKGRFYSNHRVVTQDNDSSITGCWFPYLADC